MFIFYFFLSVVAGFVLIEVVMQEPARHENSVPKMKGAPAQQIAELLKPAELGQPRRHQAAGATQPPQTRLGLQCSAVYDMHAAHLNEPGKPSQLSRGPSDRQARDDAARQDRSGSQLPLLNLSPGDKSRSLASSPQRTRESVPSPPAKSPAGSTVVPLSTVATPLAEHRKPIETTSGTRRRLDV